VLALINHEKYVEDLEKIDYVNIGNESDINSTYEIFEKSYLEVVNKHIPLKKRKPVQTPAPFMNKTLRKEIYKKRMLHNKFLKNRSKVNWENYRKQRNHVNKVKEIYPKLFFLRDVLEDQNNLIFGQL
jgi:hypothetical protein